MANPKKLDLQPLNGHAVKETHHTQSPFHQARQVPKHTKKTVFDCWNGSHSVPLSDDRHYTTFITPWGRYRYKAASQGYIASGDGFTRGFDEIVSHIPRKTKCIDDTLLWSYDLERSFWQAVEWLDVCGRHGITLNPEKFVFGAGTVPFAGFEITQDSVRSARRYLDAIYNFPTPSSITDVRFWFGLVSQVSYAFATADHMLPFRQLFKPDTPFRWDEELDKLFKNSKQVIAKEIEEGIAIFDVNRTTCLVTDWSKTETLQLQQAWTLLLPNRMEDGTRRQLIHSLKRSQLRTRWRRSLGSCGWVAQSKIFCARMQRPN